MPAKEIKELRKSGKLLEAYDMAKAELAPSPEDIWAKRNLAWVIVDYLKASVVSLDHCQLIERLNELAGLDMPAEETILYENICWSAGKYLFALVKGKDLGTLSFQEKNEIVNHAVHLFEVLKLMPVSHKSDGYSFLFKGLHKILKETNLYVKVADWWNFEHFMEADYQKEKLPDGKEIMSMAEQAYICYAKHLLPRQTQDGLLFDRDKVLKFIEQLDRIIEAQPKYTYTEYYKAKLLYALGEEDDMFASLLPFARRKKNEFWVWDILADAFKDAETKIACYSKAMTCRTPPEFLVKVHQKLAALLVATGMFNEAKTEIETLIKLRTSHGWNVPNEVKDWTLQPWYTHAKPASSNMDFYKSHFDIADSVLYFDTPEENVIIEFVNTDKKLAHFIASESKFGFFKYERAIEKLQCGDVVKVRFNGNSSEGFYKIYSLRLDNDAEFKAQFYKDVQGQVKIPVGKNIGFVNQVFVPTAIINKHNLQNGDRINGKAMKSYNKEKNTWGWKMVDIGI